MAKTDQIAAELRRLRKESGLSRERVGAVLRYSAKSIERWETSGNVRPNKLAVLRAFYAEAIKNPDAIERLDNDARVTPLSGARLAPPEDPQTVAEAVNDAEPRAYLTALRERLHTLGASPDEEDAAVFAARSAAVLAGVTHLDDVMAKIAGAAEALIRYFAELKSRRESLATARHPLPKSAPSPHPAPSSRAETAIK